MDKGFLQFETVTLVPIQTKMLDANILSDNEVMRKSSRFWETNFTNCLRFQIQWINAYHETCREVIGPALQEQDRKRAFKWLMKETQAIG